MLSPNESKELRKQANDIKRHIKSLRQTIENDEIKLCRIEERLRLECDHDYEYEGAIDFFVPTASWVCKHCGHKVWRGE